MILSYEGDGNDSPTYARFPDTLGLEGRSLGKFELYTNNEVVNSVDVLTCHR